MQGPKQIKTALISVYHKDGLDEIIKSLDKLNIKIFSTGGTYDFITKLGVEAIAVETITDYPSILGGRVKTLHPKIFGGILARQEEQPDIDQLIEYDIPAIDLVVVDLYPFEETLVSTNDEQEIIEKIDIGGISLIRAGAKNYNSVLIIPSKNEYDFLYRILTEKEGSSEIEDRKKMAAKAFQISSGYDSAIFGFFSGGARKEFKKHASKVNTLRYGENPHQEGIFYGDLEQVFSQLHGKEISYNNLIDIESAIDLINEFPLTDSSKNGGPSDHNGHTMVIIKHTNACGLATRNTLLDAWNDALACDNISAFGGIIASNTTINEVTANAINEIFYEVLIAPDYDDKALEILRLKKNRRILKLNTSNDMHTGTKKFRSILNGVIEQDNDFKTETEKDLTSVTHKEASAGEIEDLLFANKAVKHLKSNTIVLVKNKQMVGSGVGQTSRVDALRQAISKAETFGFDVKGAVMASDAFFPFPDCVQIANEHGINTVIQPGGSIKDQDSIDYCNDHDMVMVTTGTRHFKH